MKPDNEPTFSDRVTIEQKIKDRRYWRIGWAIMNMTRFERIWWAMTGRGKYMKTTFWDAS